jgi:glutamate-1-semialdehyde 2,1-aminomutase
MKLNARYRASNAMIERALITIPLGSQTFSKSITQFPRGVSPLFIARGQGSHVWDVDGNEYVDFMNGLLSVSIGYNHPGVNEAVRAQLENGVIFSLPHVLEAEVAEMLVELIPCAEMVRFGKNGTDATSAAIRLARAHTGRERILVCGYHGWQDWYIGSTARHLGVPKAVRELTHTFKYNDIPCLEALFSRYPGEVAAVIMEPMNIAWPEPGYLARAREIAHANGALFIFDETITGCRFAKGGAQELFGVTPDLATFGKGIGNGFPLSAVVGKREIMRRMEDIFFSGTFGGETLSLAAAKKVLGMIANGDVVQRLRTTGEKVMEGLNRLIARYGAEEMIKLNGHPSWTLLEFRDTGGYTSWQLKTLYLQEMFRRGILTIGTHNISYAHDDVDVAKLLGAYDEVLPLLVSAVKDANLEHFLEAKPLEPVFKVR